MENPKAGTESASPRFSSVVSKFINLLSALRLVFGEMGQSFSKNLDRLLRRTEYLFVIYLWVSIGVLFIVLGSFDLLIDYAGVPRGVVFGVGGLLIALVSILLLQAVKIKKYKE